MKKNNFTLFLEELTNKDLLKESYGELWMYVKQLPNSEIKNISKNLTKLGLNIEDANITPTELVSNRDVKINDPNVILFWVFNYGENGKNDIKLGLISNNKKNIYVKNDYYYSITSPTGETFKDKNGNKQLDKFATKDLMKFAYKIFYVDITDSPYDVSKRNQRIENQKNAIALERERNKQEWANKYGKKGTYSWEEYASFAKNTRNGTSIDKSGYNIDKNKYKKILDDIKTKNAATGAGAKKYVDIMLNYQTQYINYQNFDTIKSFDENKMKEYFNVLGDLSYSIGNLGRYLNDILFYSTLLASQLNDGLEKLNAKNKENGKELWTKEEYDYIIGYTEIDLKRAISSFSGIEKDVKGYVSKIEKIIG